MNSFIKDLASVFKSRIIVLVLGLGSSVLTARFLGPEGNGIIAAVMVYPSLFMTFGSLGIQQSTTYFIGQEKASIQKVYGSILVLWVFTSIFCLLSSYALINFYSKNDYSQLIIILAIISIPFSLFNTYSAGLFLGLQNIKEYNKINWMPTAINFGFTFLLIAVFSYGIEGSMLGSFLGVFIFSIFVYFNIKRLINVKPEFSLATIKGMLALGGIYALSLLITNLNYKADVILLERYSDAYQLGIYSKGAVIVEYLWQIPMLLSTIIFSRSAGAKNSLEFSLKTCQLLRFSVIIIFIASLLLLVSGNYIITLLFGKEFFESAIVLKILMPGVLLLTIFKVLNMDIAGRGKPWIAIIAMLPGVLLNVVLNYFWIPQYGANGSALASTISYAFSALLFLYVYSREVEIPIKVIFKFTQKDVDIVRNLYSRLFKKQIKC